MTINFYYVLKTCYVNGTKYKKINELELEQTYEAWFDNLEEV
jgi:hypothetical protein